VAGNKRTPEDFDELTERQWPDPDAGPYLLTLYWKRRNGRPEPVGINLIHHGAGSGKTESFLTLTTSLLREVKLAEIVAEDRERLAYIPPAPPTPDEVVAGMRPATARRLGRAAEVYQAAWHAGSPPTQAVAQQMNVSVAAAANLVRRARQAGFLPPTTGGVPQG
jgi:hypothetical protein